MATTTNLIARHIGNNSTALNYVNSPPIGYDPLTTPLGGIQGAMAAVEDRQLMVRMQQAVMEQRERVRPVNTKIQQDPRVLEYFQYCDLVSLLILTSTILDSTKFLGSCGIK